MLKMNYRRNWQSDDDESEEDDEDWDEDWDDWEQLKSKKQLEWLDYDVLEAHS